MKKTSMFSQLSTRRCSCGKLLKQRLVDDKPTVALCYRCFNLKKKAAGKAYRIFKRKYEVNPIPAAHHVGRS